MRVLHYLLASLSLCLRRWLGPDRHTQNTIRYIADLVPFVGFHPVSISGCAHVTGAECVGRTARLDSFPACTCARFCSARLSASAAAASSSLRRQPASDSLLLRAAPSCEGLADIAHHVIGRNVVEGNCDGAQNALDAMAGKCLTYIHFTRHVMIRYYLIEKRG